MTHKKLIDWMRYWDMASMGVNLHKVHDVADMHLCRCYNPIMQRGVMHDVTDQQMWRALCDYREARG